MSFVSKKVELNTEDNSSNILPEYTNSTIKQEPLDVIENSEPIEAEDVTELYKLYEEHEIKQEMVIGPVVLQKNLTKIIIPIPEQVKNSEQRPKRVIIQVPEQVKNSKQRPKRVIKRVPDQVKNSEQKPKRVIKRVSDVVNSEQKTKKRVIKQVPAQVENSEQRTKNTVIAQVPSLDFKLAHSKKWKPTTLSVRQRNTIINSFEYVKANWPKLQNRSKLEMVKETSKMTGISSKTIYGVLKELKTAQSKTKENIVSKETKNEYAFLNTRQKFEDGNKSAIRRKIHEFYNKGILPNVDIVLEAIREDGKLANFKRTSILKVLKHLKFELLKVNRRSVVVDHQDVILSRIHYLKKIEKFRSENRRIFYLDEASFAAAAPPEAKSLAEVERLIVVHIGNEAGFVEDCQWLFKCTTRGFFGQMMSALHFESWFGKVLKKLKNGDVIVMDNAAYHSRRLNNTPTMFWDKQEIVKWLKTHKISVQPEDIKAELINKAKRVKNYGLEYVIDEMATEKGMEVLRLPPYHGELNPMEQLWADMREYVDKNKTINLSDLKNLVTELLTVFTPDKWRDYLEIVKKEEAKLRVMDREVDKLVDQFIIQAISSVDECTDSENTDSDCEFSSSEL